jgi:hypothetical protein
MASRQEMIAEVYTCYCAACASCFKSVPTVHDPDGHGNDRRIGCTSCGCDLIVRLDNNELVKSTDPITINCG